MGLRTLSRWLTKLFCPTGTPYSPPSPQATDSSATMSPTMSPIYPDRPIRPLPKRSLRERMSPEVADKAPSYPLDLYSKVSSTHVPYSKPIVERNGPVVKNVSSNKNNKPLSQAQKGPVEEEQGAYRFRGNEVNSEDEDDVGVDRRHQISQRNGNGTMKGHSHDPDKSHSASSNESADGYESFENTSNKKKRKIPTSGNLPASMSASLSQDLANLGISNEEESIDQVDDGTSHYYSTGTGVSLHGSASSNTVRGKYGRPTKREPPGRVPLYSSMNAYNLWPDGKNAPAESRPDRPEMKGKCFLQNFSILICI